MARFSETCRKFTVLQGSKRVSITVHRADVATFHALCSTRFADHQIEAVPVTNCKCAPIHRSAAA